MSRLSHDRHFKRGEPRRFYPFLRAIIALIISIFCVISLKQIFGVTYAVNDDIGMMEIAAGVTTFEPDVHFIFMRGPLTNFIVMLYRQFWGFDWYALTMYAIQILASAIFIFYFVKYLNQERNHGIVWSHIIAVFLLLTCRVYSILLLQFTTTATAIMGTVLFLFADIVTYHEPFRWEGYLNPPMVTGRRLGPRYVWLVLLTWLAYMVRRNVLFMALPFLLGFLVLRIILTVDRKIVLRRMVGILATILILTAITHVFEYKAYNTPVWQQYHEFNTARSHIYDHYALPPYGDCADAYPATGLSAAEINILRLYGLNLLPDVSAEQLDQLADIAADYYHNSFAGVQGRVSFTFKRLGEHLTKPDFWPSAAIALLGCVIALIYACLPRRIRRLTDKTQLKEDYSESGKNVSKARQRPWTILYLFGSLLFVFVILFYFVWANRFILRVVHGLLIYLLTSALVTIMFSETPKPIEFRSSRGGRSVFSLALAVLLAVTFSVSLNSVLPELRTRQAINVTYEKFIGTMEMWGYGDKILVHPPGAIGPITPGIRFFQEPLENELITLGGWRSRSPVAAEQWHQRGLELTDGYLIFEKNPEVRLLVSDQSIAARVQELLDEKGVNVQYVLERTWMDRDFYVEIYRFEPSR